MICQWYTEEANLGPFDPHAEGELITSSGFYCEDTCVNTINNGTPVHRYVCDRRPNVESSSQQSDMGHSKNFHEKALCDRYCDGPNCEDEAFCHNLTIGLYCRHPLSIGEIIYVPANQICDGSRNCFSNIDENDCENFTDFCITDNYYLMQDTGKISTDLVRRFLSPRSKCSIPAVRREKMVCVDYRDQMNCTGSTISPLVCNVHGYPTTISEHVICQGKSLSLCDDKIDNQCIEAETECTIHKHKLCDGINDCQKGYDEGSVFCKNEFSNQTINCVRKLSRDNVARKLPNQWLLDGVSDCRNDVDESPEYWRKLCGFGLLNFHVYYNNSDENADCSQVTQLKCPLSSKLLNLERVCTGNAMDNCDAEVCTTARKEFHITDKLKDIRSASGAKRTCYCLPGLKEVEMYAGNCSEMKFPKGRRVVGIPDILVLTSQKFAISRIECSEIFGELYVYLMCSGLCKMSADDCPLKFTIGFGTCLNFPPAKTVVSLGGDGMLALGIVKSKNTFSSEIFSCENGRCTTFDKVCNLVDDCAVGISRMKITVLTISSVKNRGSTFR